MKIAVLAAAGITLLGGGVAYSQMNRATGCSDKSTTEMVIQVLSGRFHIPGNLSLENIRTESGGIFGNSYQCAADVAGIQGQYSVGDVRFNAVSYTSSVAEDTGDYVVTAKIVPTRG